MGTNVLTKGLFPKLLCYHFAHSGEICPEDKDPSINTSPVETFPGDWIS